MIFKLNPTSVIVPTILLRDKPSSKKKYIVLVQIFEYFKTIALPLGEKGLMFVLFDNHVCNLCTLSTQRFNIPLIL